MDLSEEVTISFDPFNLDESGEEPRYGIEVLFNEVLVDLDSLGQRFTTEPFTLNSVNAELGLGPDNFITLGGVNYSADGGDNWMGIDYEELNGKDDTPPTFEPITISNSQVTISWSGNANLEWAPTVNGPWTAISPAPTSPYSEDANTATSRFFRLSR